MKQKPRSVALHDTYSNRRLWLMLALTLLGFLAGFVWGLEFGYERGKGDTMKAIEKKLAKPQRRAILI